MNPSELLRQHHTPPTKLPYPYHIYAMVLLFMIPVYYLHPPLAVVGLLTSVIIFIGLRYPPTHSTKYNHQTFTQRINTRLTDFDMVNRPDLKGGDLSKLHFRDSMRLHNVDFTGCRLIGATYLCDGMKGHIVSDHVGHVHYDGTDAYIFKVEFQPNTIDYVIHIDIRAHRLISWDSHHDPTGLWKAKKQEIISSIHRKP